MEELSAGQAQTLARNEQVIDQSTDDLEDLEEQINNSIAESLKGKKNKLEADNLKTEKRWYLLLTGFESDILLNSLPNDKNGQMWINRAIKSELYFID